MNAAYRASYIFLCLLLNLSACQQWDLERADFPQITFEEPQVMLATLELEGRIAGLANGKISSHGFLYATQTENPVIGNINTTQIDLGAINTNRSFNHSLSGIKINTNYYLRAFFIFEGETIYSEVKQFASELNLNLEVTAKRLVPLENTAIVEGRISGWPPELSIEQYGHCWSSDNPAPSIAGTYNDFGETDQDSSEFSTTLLDMEPLRPYYIRTYAIVDGVILYGAVDTIIKKDIWVLEDDTFPFLGSEILEGGVFAIGEKLYVLFRVIPDFSTTLLYAYSRADSWVAKTSFPGLPRWYEVAASVGGKGYVGLSKLGMAPGTLLIDLWEYDPNSLANGLDEKGNPMGAWCRKADFPGVPRENANMIGLADKIYFGMGSGNGQSYQDFWEFDPANMEQGSNECDQPFGKWSRIDSYPDGPGSSMHQIIIEDKAYLLGGIRNSTSGDPEAVYELQPSRPTGEQWRYKRGFSSSDRRNGVSFSINGKGYLGMGGGQKDLWEFEPEALNSSGEPLGKWHRVNALPDISLDAAYGTSWLGDGIIFFGRFREDPSLVNTTIWRYIAED